MKVKARSRLYVQYKRRYVKLGHNQLMILEALMEHGGRYRKYVDRQRRMRYSEHFGLIDFNRASVDKLVVSARTNRQDADDKEMLLPHDMDGMYDYEYMFHTHPPTPKEGGRAKYGILYELPSSNDMFHFIHYFNRNETQGSIVVAPEGIYVIRPRHDRHIIVDRRQNKQIKRLDDAVDAIQAKAIARHGKTFTDEYFYGTIAQEKEVINKVNEVLKEEFGGGGLKIDYYPRRYDRRMRRWVYRPMYLPVKAVEPRARVGPE